MHCLKPLLTVKKEPHLRGPISTFFLKLSSSKRERWIQQLLRVEPPKLYAHVSVCSSHPNHRLKLKLRTVQNTKGINNVR